MSLNEDNESDSSYVLDSMGYVDRQLHQIAALPLFLDSAGGVEMCLVTARGSGRWIIPKGNPIRGRAPHEMAAQEALEEAGLIGRVGKRSIGTFEFNRIRDGQEETCSVDVYVLKVERQLNKWAEMEQRSVLRCSVQTALSLICSPGLAVLIDRYVSSDMRGTLVPADMQQTTVTGNTAGSLGN